MVSSRVIDADDDDDDEGGANNNCGDANQINDDDNEGDEDDGCEMNMMMKISGCW